MGALTLTYSAGSGNGARSGHAPTSFDTRQRAIVKDHYFSHGGVGGAALKAHAACVARRDPW
jgi:hypothetical protein